MPHSTVMSPSETALLVVDIQEKLIPKIHGRDNLLLNASFLLEAAHLLEVAIVGTEQYPKGLGPTVPALVDKIPKPLPEKVGFSCCAVPTLVPSLQAQDRFRVVLTGIETHVCVLHTALDLLAEDFWVYIPVDAVGSRFSLDHEMALRRLESAGAVLTTSEAIVFEWLGGADHPKFKEISGLVQKRMKQLMG